jgi:hypothetical protein
MTATDAVELSVSVVPGVELDPEVAKAIERATNVLIELIRQHHLAPARRKLMWATSGEPPFQSVRAHLSETDEYGRRQSDRPFSRSRLLDAVNREGVMINLLLDVRGQRREKIGDAVRRGVDALEDEEVANGKPD